LPLRVDRVNVLPLGHFVLLGERLVACDVVLRLQIVGLGLVQRRFCGFKLSLGDRQTGGCVLDVGLC
jgi:hypothetical protein